MSDTLKPGYDPKWKEKYEGMLATAEEAVAAVRPGQRVFVGTGGAQPLQLVRALVARHAELADTQVIHMLTLGEAPYAFKDLSDHFSVNTFFVADNVRNIIQEGYGDYTPIFLYDVPQLFESGQMPLDVALIQVTPPDEQGRCSLGISVDIVKSAAKNAGLVIAQVNPQMPRTMGDSFVSVFDLDVLVPVDEPLLEIESARAQRDHPGHRREHSLAGGRRLHHRDGHRTHPSCGARVPQGQEGPGHPQRDDHRRRHRHDRSRRGHGGPEAHRPGQSGDQLRHRHEAPVRLRGRQPALLVQPHRVRQRLVRHRAAAQDGGHQHRSGDRPHRPGLRRLAGHQVLLGHRRPGRLQPRCGPLRRRPAHHRPALDGQGRQGVAHRRHSHARRREW